MLVAHGRYSRQEHGRGKPMYRLAQSLASVFRKQPQLTDIYAANTIYQQVSLHYPKLNIGVGHKFTDKCRICRTWDWVVVKPIIEIVDGTMDDLMRLLPGYWQSFPAICEEHGFNAPDFANVESSKFLESLKDFVENHSVDCADLREGMQDRQMDLRMANDTEFVIALESVIPEVKGYEGHWSTITWIWNYKLALRWHCAGGIMVYESDWGGPIIFFICYCFLAGVVLLGSGEHLNLGCC